MVKLLRSLINILGFNPKALCALFCKGAIGLWPFGRDRAKRGNAKQLDSLDIFGMLPT